MKASSRVTKVLSYESFGFLAVITLCWLNSLLGLPSLIFEGRLQMSDFNAPVLQMLLVLTVWLLVGASTRRLLDRVQHLERFLRVCSWCRCIDYKGKWIPLEDFMQQGFDTPTTHGICPTCLEHQKHTLEQQNKEAREKNSRNGKPGSQASLSKTG